MRWRALAVLAVIFILLRPAHALAYRPFDQTDADVAKPKEVEVELGPVGILHESGHNVLVPGFTLNYGLASRLEAVLDGRAGIGLGTLSPDEARWTFEPALLVKGVLREGSLQERSGVSVALEVGLLLPEPHLASTGASAALIASQRWPMAALHVNFEAEWTREATLDVVAGAIAEGPLDWKVRPVGEASIERAEDAGTTTSLLAGAIWRAREGLSFDGAVRVVPVADRPAVEVRLGLTWAVSA